MEELMYYIWKHRLFDQHMLKMVDGSMFEIIDSGTHNTDSGPDFFNAKIKINDQVWAGNIELHQRSSDWYAHKHDTDKAYDSVIINVVEYYDMDIRRTNGEMIHQFIMTVPESLRLKYNLIINHTDQLPCEIPFTSINKLYIKDWINALAFERLHRKSTAIQDLLELYNGDREQICFIVLARSFGSSLNNDAFERLARSLPLIYLRKHSDSILSIEAMLYGQAGLLDVVADNSLYVTTLVNEFQFLKHKFQLTSLIPETWRYFRLRPSAFPHIRIAQLANFLYSNPSFYNTLLKLNTLDDLHAKFNFTLNDYWQTHYLFGHESSVRIKQIGQQTFYSVIINAIIPLLYTFASIDNQPHIQNRAIEMLEQLKPESNSVVKQWNMRGISVDSAFESQAIIELQKEYCDKKRCLFCRIGHQYLKDFKQLPLS